MRGGGGTFIDNSKAFDTVSHALLLGVLTWMHFHSKEVISLRVIKE